MLNKIQSMYQQGFPYSSINIETGVSVNVIRNRVGKTKDAPSTGRRMYFRPVENKPINKPHKYDHLFEEPRAQGKMYEEYLKEKNIKVHELL